MPDINIWAVVASMVLSVVIGFVWYGPLFGKKWMALSGIVMPDVKPGMSTMIKPIIMSFIASGLMSYMFSAVLTFHNAFFGIMGYGAALSFAFAIWLGFMMPVYLNLTGWEGKSWTLFFINA
ncbi:MAG: hypothetical protein JWO00_307, partial [Candidatus Parcubacteria bacterium]|nr:hypothetical protein [Candidatus Parcubacteria bacterium]